MKESVKKILTKLQLKIYFCSNSYVPLLSSLMQSSRWIEDKNQNCAIATNGNDFYYNSELLEQEKEEHLFADFIHVLWHIARLHNIRGKGKNRVLWEVVCDAVIDDDLARHLDQYSKYYKPREVPVRLKPEFRGISEERLYDYLLDNLETVPVDLNVESEDLSNAANREVTQAQDLICDSTKKSALQFSLKNNTTEQNQNNQLLKLQSAIQQQRMSPAGLNEIADIAHVLESFGRPKVDWRKQLKQFLIDKAEPEDITWRRPNRRYPDLYMPSKDSDTGRLAHLMYFIDVSGSVTEQDIDDFLTEVHGVFNELEPDELTVISFNHKIQQRWDFNKENPFRKIEININGGTSYEGIYDILASEVPTAAVIFTDLCCDPMEPVKKVPVLWVVKDGLYDESHQLQTGRIIKIPNKESAL